MQDCGSKFKGKVLIYTLKLIKIDYLKNNDFPNKDSDQTETRYE